MDVKTQEIKNAATNKQINFCKLRTYLPEIYEKALKNLHFPAKLKFSCITGMI